MPDGHVLSTVFDQVKDIALENDVSIRIVLSKEDVVFSGLVDQEIFKTLVSTPTVEDIDKRLTQYNKNVLALKKHIEETTLIMGDLERDKARLLEPPKPKLTLVK